MGKTLVAYFSASGVTAKLAQRFADAIDGDIARNGTAIKNHFKFRAVGSNPPHCKPKADDYACR